MASTLPQLPIFEAIAKHDPQSTAVIHSVSGRRFKYGELLKDVADGKDRLVKEAGGKSVEGQRIAFLVENSYDYVGAQSVLSPSIRCRINEKYSISTFYSWCSLNCTSIVACLSST